MARCGRGGAGIRPRPRPEPIVYCRSLLCNIHVSVRALLLWNFTIVSLGMYSGMSDQSRGTHDPSLCTGDTADISSFELPPQTDQSQSRGSRSSTPKGEPPLREDLMDTAFVEELMGRPPCRSVPLPPARTGFHEWVPVRGRPRINPDPRASREAPRGARDRVEVSR